MSEEQSSEAHRVQIDFGSERWNKMVRLGYKGSVSEYTRKMWDDKIAKEEGHEISGDEAQLKSFQKSLGDALDKRLKLLKDIDPQCSPETPLRDRPVLVRFATLFVAAGGHVESPSDIVNHKIKAELFKKIRKAESKLDGSQKVLSQRLPDFIDFLLAENDVGRLERLISAPPEPIKPPVEVGGKNFDEFTQGPPREGPPVFTPAVPETTVKVAAEKPIDSAEKMERLRDIMFESPGGLNTGSRNSSHPSDKE